MSFRENKVNWHLSLSSRFLFQQSSFRHNWFSSILIHIWSTSSCFPLRAFTFKKEVSSQSVAVRQLDAAFERNSNFINLMQLFFLFSWKQRALTDERTVRVHLRNRVLTRFGVTKIRGHDKGRLYADVALEAPPPAALPKFREAVFSSSGTRKHGAPHPAVGRWVFQFSL